MRYQAILFDLFDTVVRFDDAKMPEVVVNGKARRTTMGMTFQLLLEKCPDIQMEHFFHALSQADEEMRLQKEAGKEFSATHRFSRVLRILLPEGTEFHAPEFVEQLVKEHMRALLGCAYLPEEHRALLEELRGSYPLGLLSNFDYAPAAEEMIDGMGLREYFVKVAISDALGWRKPHPRVFQNMAAELGVRSADCVYIGDTYETDVLGAKKAGMNVFWINWKGQELPGEVHPDIEMSSFVELRDHLLPDEKGRLG